MGRMSWVGVGVLAGMCIAAVESPAQCITRFSGLGGFGTNRTNIPAIQALLRWPSETGEPERLVAYGQFANISGVAAINTALWDGSGWRAMGDNLRNDYFGLGTQMIIWRGQLLACGGLYLTPSNAGPLIGIARWNGVTWEPLAAAVPGAVASMVEFEGDLIVGGRFGFRHNGLSIDSVARWNGESWSSVGLNTPANTLSSVSSLAVLDGALHAWSFSGLTRLEGGLWRIVDVGIPNTVSVSSLIVHNNLLIVLNGRPGSQIVAWDHSSATDITPTNFAEFSAVSLSSIRGTLYAAGRFQRGATEPLAGAAAWDGVSWRLIGDDPRDRFSGNAYALVEFGGEFVLAGDYSVYGPQPARGFSPVVAGGIGRLRCNCPGDLDDGSGMGIRDDAATIDDLIYYANLFAAGDTFADLDDGTRRGQRDGAVTIDDLLYFLEHYELGC